KHLRFAYLVPTQRGATLSSEQGFIWGHLDAGLVTVVVGELSVGETTIPCALEVQGTCSKHVLQDLVNSFCLPICLRVVGSTEI
ncbi:hypothetical protein ACXWOE_09255, partial [Streptococcus pyogenes]